MCTIVCGQQLDDFPEISKAKACFEQYHTRDGISSEPPEHLCESVSAIIIATIRSSRLLALRQAIALLKPKQLRLFRSAYEIERDRQARVAVRLVPYAVHHLIAGRPDWPTWICNELARIRSMMNDLVVDCRQL